MRGKQRNIFAAFGERGHFEWKDIQAVKQILPESSFLDLLAQIAVRGGNDPHIYLDDSLSTKPLDLSLLNHAQKIRLHVERKLTNFVQEDGATIPLFEQSFLLGDSARESTLFIPVGPGGTPENWTERPVGRAKQAALVTGLTPGTAYAFQVRAVTDAGYTDWSESVTRICT